MAGADAPDPRDFESWEDAFKYPIPAVRGMEKKLRAGANENGDKLKTLVGVSYRELLGTAHTIIDANSQIHTVESLLVDVGRRCDSRILNKIASNHVQLQAENTSPDNRQNRRASQLFLLQQSLKIVARILRTHGSSLLAAKLLVVARLLHKTLPQTSDDHFRIENHFGKRLVSLRSKLLRHIDRRLERSFAENVHLVQELTAFALATSSAPSDVLRHYQHLRAEAIKKPLPTQTSVNTTVLERFLLYFNTAREIKAVYPDLLQVSLRTLSMVPLLDDPEIHSLDELRLDSHSYWISADIKHFSPWTRHDEPNKSDLGRALESWSQVGLEAFTMWLKEQLPTASDIHSLLLLRTDVLQLWQSSKHYIVLSTQSGAPGLDPARVLSDFAVSFTQRFNEFIEPRFTDLLHAIKQSLSDLLTQTHGEDASDWTLWNQQTLSTSITNGAASLRDTIVRRRSGHDDNIKKMLRAFEKGDQDIKEVQQVIKQMRDTKWDDDDVYENDTYPSWLLAEREPNEIQKHLTWQASLVVGNLEQFLAERLSPELMECHGSSSPALFLLRAIRELRHNIPRLLQDIEPDSARKLVFSDIVDRVYVGLSETLVQRTAPNYRKTLEKYVHSWPNPRGLWEGTSPPLPIQITPATFQTLRTATKEMEAFGPDVWAPEATAAVRRAFDAAFAEIVRDTVKMLEERRNSPAADTTFGTTEPEHGGTAIATDARPATPADGPDGASETELNRTELKKDEIAAESALNASSNSPGPSRDAEVSDKLTQLLFDAAYLSNALASPTDTAQPGEQERKGTLADEVVPGLVAKAGLDESSLARINKSATDYWRKTYLLFGLLCA